MNWTSQQQKAIEEKGSTLLVSAAAGSGKTAVLVERIRRLVMEENMGLDRMLVVTFTRAAAGEMKEKIYKSLSKALADPRTDADKKRLLRHQLSLIGRADICTFDQFCLEIVHRYYHVTGIAPGIGVCDEGRGDILRREALDELFDARFEAADPDFIDFLTRYCSSRSNSEAREMILEFSNFLQSLPDPDGWMDSICAEDLDPSVFIDFASSNAVKLMNVAMQYLDRAAELLGDVPKMNAKVMLDKAHVMSALSAVESDPATGLAAIGDIKWERMVATKDEKAAYDAVKAQVSECIDCAKTLCRKKCLPFAACSEEVLVKERALLLPRIRTLCALTRDFNARFLEKKLALNLMDFSDIAHEALKILADGKAAEEYRSKFEYIFVDEYQDSNLVQDSLIRLITRPENCFMVGDVKQSIYKFRQAEPELFLEKYGAFRRGEPVGPFSGRVIDLNSNFRSTSAVIDSVNSVFEKLMTPASCGILYDDDAKLHQGGDDRGLPGKAELWIADSTFDDEPEDAEVAELRTAELEALQAVKIIKEHHLRSRVRDDDLPDGRPLEYRDMVILTRSVRQRAEVFYSILSAAGIPVLLERGEGYFDTIEISVFLNLLRLIDNAKQDIPLLSVLHFPSFGFSADELAAVRIFANGKGQYRIPYNRAFELYVSDGPEGTLKDKCASFAARLADWRMRALYTPLGDFLWELLSSAGIEDFSAAIPGGDQRRANLRALVEKAESYESGNAGGLHGFISYIEMLTAKGGKVDMGQARILSEGTDAVRIMTIHKSKGLEFPFVLVAGTASRFNTGRSKAGMHFHKDFGAAFKLVDRRTSLSYKPVLFDLLAEKARADELAEEIRVLYVAMTRPKDILILSGVTKAPQERIGCPSAVPGDIWNASCYLDLLLPLIPACSIRLTGRTELTELLVKTETDRTRLAAMLREGFPVEEPTGFTDEELLERLSFTCPVPSGSEKRKYSVSELAEMAREGRRTGKKYLEAETEKDVPLPLFIKESPVLSSTEKGTAYHTVMEHIPFTPGGHSPEEVAEFIAELLSRNILTAAQASVIDPARISAFFDSEIGKRAVRGSDLRKEAPFTLQMDHMGKTVLVQGTIDCCFIEDGCWILVDYKSNYVDAENRESSLAHLRENYIPQLALYRKALEEITGIPVKEGVLYLFGIDEELTVC